MNALANFVTRAREPSTAAGVGLVCNALPALIANPRDPQAWGGLLGGLLAIVLREKAHG